MPYKLESLTHMGMKLQLQARQSDTCAMSLDISLSRVKIILIYSRIVQNTAPLVPVPTLFLM